MGIITRQAAHTKRYLMAVVAAVAVITRQQDSL
jgi:hypothetical protein